MIKILNETQASRAGSATRELPAKRNGVARLSKQYLAELLHHVGRRSEVAPKSAQRLGREVLLLGLETLDLARMHEQALLPMDGAPAPRKSLRAQARHADAFFLEAVIPIEATHHAARELRIRSQALYEALRRRTAVVATTKRRLDREIVRRKTVERDLVKSAEHYSRLLMQAHRMGEQMRGLARRILLAQEEERREISRELHDEIAQTLAGINVQLASLKEAAATNTQGLNRKIAATQRLVEHSVNIVHRFARDLRPAVLDDLGLIPALRSFMKALPGRRGLRIDFKAFSGVEAMDSARRTVLYRVAHEALVNVIRHAHATMAKVQITKIPGAVRMEISDDGRSFHPDRIFASKKNKRLGLLGMRERVEMVGGSFIIESARGKGTTVRAEIPFNGLVEQ